MALGLVVIIHWNGQLNQASAQETKKEKIDRQIDNHKEVLPKGAIGRLFAGNTEEIEAVAFSLDSKTIIIATVDKLYLWDVTTGKMLKRIAGFGRKVAITADSNTIATTRGPCRYCLLDLNTEKVIHEKRMPDSIHGLCPSPRGEYVAISMFTDYVPIWKFPTTSEMLRLNGAYPIRQGMTFTHDGGKLVALWRSPERFVVQVWDTIKGELLPPIKDSVLDAGFSPTGIVAFPDNHTLAVASVREIYFYDIVSHTKLRTLRCPGDMISLSPDGKILASTSMNSKRRKIHLIEVATGKELAQFDGHQEKVASLQFAPNSRILASASEDHTLVLWDWFTPQVPTQASIPPGEKLAELWADLDSPDASVAWHALRAHAAHPAEALDLARKHAKPALREEGARIQRLIEDLDSRDFKLRAKADRQLADLGVLAEPQLRKALRSQPSTEASMRISRICQSMWTTPPPAGWLRQIRLIQVLERIGTDEAKRILSLYADAAPWAQTTLDSQAALARLNFRQQTK